MDKKNKYDKVLGIIETTLSGDLELSFEARMSLISAILHMVFGHWTFCGFYVMRRNPDMLEIGPYQGNILPCTHIPIGLGVCGTSVKEKKTIIVDDVREWANYISCDSDTISEIVVPIIHKEEVKAVLDIDSPFLSDFDEIDKFELERISSII